MLDKEFFETSKERVIAMYKSVYHYGPVTHDIELHVHEYDCVFNKITRLFGLAVWKTTETFATLLDAEERFDAECLTCSEKGYYDGTAN